LNLNIIASRQNIIYLVRSFGALHLGNMDANFQASSSIGEGGGGGNRRYDGKMDVLPFLEGTVMKFLNYPLHFGRENI